MLADLIFNGVVLALDGLIVWWIWRSERLFDVIASIILGAAFSLLTAVIIAVVLNESGFRVVRFAAYGLFLHAPIILLATATLQFWRRRWLTAVCGAAIVVLAATGIQMFCVEPEWLQLTHHEIVSAKVAGPVRIAVVADIQTDYIGEYHRQAFRRVMAEKPDILIFAGDYVQTDSHPAHETVLRQLNGVLAEAAIDAPQGVFAVQGNCEPPHWPEIFAGLPVETPVNTTTFETDVIAVTCLCEADSFRPDTRVAGREKYHVVVGHSPDFSLGDINADLLLAGHTHGGQVQLPLLGPILTLSQVPRRWGSGRTDLGVGKTLIVSRGVGMERHSAPRIRFFCRPEIVIIDVLPKRNAGK